MQWADIQFAPSEPTLRRFAAACCVVFATLAAYSAFVAHRPSQAAVHGAIAVMVGACGLVRPAWIRPLFVGWSVAAFPIGWLVSTVVLVLLYFGLFTPLAIVFRLFGRDELALRRTAASSYWKPRGGAGEKREYFRQS